MSLITVDKKLNILYLDDDEEADDWKLPLAFVKKRHTEPIEGAKIFPQSWRMKERMKTVSVALVLCLNVGVDPPDIVKTQPCARLECWIDPLSMRPQIALETIGTNLQKQYERWQPRARYRQSLDPTVEEVKKLCTSLRRSAKDERVLFHYNGHGVPKPTANGEIWVFNRQYTQYIPLSVYDLQAWMGAPSIYVYDCSNAGIIVDHFKQFAEQHEKEYEQATAQNNRVSISPPSFKNCIQLAACSADQILPMNPDLPADIFTSCLTTPIKIALRWFVLQNTSKLVPKVLLESIDKIPGQINDRRTMLGELNWIFTAITDTIAWNMLPRDLFQTLFRQDLLVASLFRNFLLAERIMRSYDCSPVSSPKLPPTYQHPMWLAWDLALDLCMAQLPAVLESEEAFKHSPFFEEQLTAFQVWLELGSEERSPPEQLPIVLQVLLSQVHRLRALELLGRFLDLGPWAVNLALSVGIFPYVLKLLQSSAKELRPLLVFIWAKILAVDESCKVDLVRDNGHKYFISVLQDPAIPSEHRTLAVFVLATMVNSYEQGQEVAMQGNLVSICLEQLTDINPLLRQWLAICLGRLWNNYDKARWCGVRDSAHEKLYILLKDDVPEVRVAAVFALGTFISCSTEHSEHATNIDQSVAMMLANTALHDMCPLVRKELVAALQSVVFAFENSFLSVALYELRGGPNFILPGDSPSSTLKRYLSKDRLKALTQNSTLLPSPPTSEISPHQGDKLKRVSSSSSISSMGHTNPSNSSLILTSLPSFSFGSVYMKLWQVLAALDSDPHPRVAKMSRIVTDYIRDQVCTWPSSRHGDAFWRGSMPGQLNARDSLMPKEIGETKVAGSVSLPPSPSNRSYLSNDSPPSGNLVNSVTELHRISPRSAHSVSFRPRKSNTWNVDTISEDTAVDDRSSETGKKKLITTKFVDWCCKHFSQPIMKTVDEIDVESSSYFEREWRYQRNENLREEAKEEQERAPQCRLEHQIFAARTTCKPSAILFHPYDSYLVVASKDGFTMWDYSPNQNCKVTQWRAEKSILSRNLPDITSLDLVNSHDNPLLLVGSSDGAVRLWNHYAAFQGTGQREPKLLSAWQAMPDLQPHKLSNSSASNNTGSGLVTCWDQLTQSLLVGGDSRYIRIWDADKELKTVDIPTGADSSLTSLSLGSKGSNIVIAGCGDGSVRLFDRRLAPQDARVRTYREHTGWVLTAQLRKDGKGGLISGCVAGDVRLYDIRLNSSVKTINTSHGMTAMSVHQGAKLFACASVSQFLSTYNMEGSLVYSFKTGAHDWFMGHVVMTPFFSPASCVAFHPHRVLLASGSVDTNVAIYSTDPKR
ncbi:unnamed protein product [Bemisia tabaci]|uniref:Raptor N-terminal CASPase-like domain-containing protein n=1 Tax=Bemisia tabaci TaxID=7038 RepID=A0A9P0ADP9_BEMTA|nr:unnamed protein product [Bemisia tabaci]